MPTLHAPSPRPYTRGRLTRRLAYALLAVISLLALGLRCWQIGESLWLDELHTAWTVSGGLAELPRRAAMGNTSPVYFLLPWASTRIFGLNEVALRLPSLVAGALLVPGLFLLVRRWTGSAAGGLLAAFLAAVDPNFLFFSLEARTYAPVQFTGLLQLAVFWELARPRPREAVPQPRWRLRAAFIGLSALLFYLHYTAILLAAAELAYLITAVFVRPARPPYRPTAWLGDLAIAALLCAPALPHLLEIAQRRGNWELFVAMPPDIYHRFHLFHAGIYAGVPAIVFALYAIFLACQRKRPPQSLSAPRLCGIWLAVCCLFIPVLIAFALTRFDIARLWMPRYVIVSAAAPMLIGGLLVSLFRSIALQSAAALVTALVALFGVGPLVQWQADGRFVARSDENWRGAIALIESDEAARDWPVLVRSGLIEADGLIESRDAALREYALLPVRSIYSIDLRRRAIPLPASRPGRIHAEDVALLAGHDGLWLITPGGEETAGATVGYVQRTLRRGGIRPGETTAYAFGSVWVVRMTLSE